MAKKQEPIRYSKRPGFHLKGDVTKIGKRLHQLEDAVGGASPEKIVEDARDPKSPLHAEFEWDDTLAAHEYRLEQARYVVRAVEAEWTYEETKVRTSAYVAVAQGSKTPYRETRRVLTNAEEREKWKAQALADLRAWRTKYNHIKELVDVYAAVDKVLKDL